MNETKPAKNFAMPKKVLSIILSLLMLTSITAGIDFSAFAADDLSSAKSIAINSSVTSQNSNLFKVSTTEAGKLTIWFSNAYVNSPYGWDISVCTVNQYGNLEIQQDKDRALNEQSVYCFNDMFLPAGTYYIKVVADNSSYVTDKSYTVSATFDASNGKYEVENNDTFDKANVLPLGGEIVGNSWNDKSDTDWYAVTTTVNGKLTIGFSHSYNNSPYGWNVSLYSLNQFNNTQLLQTSNICLNAENSFTFNVMGLKPATYYIKVVSDNSSSVAGQLYSVKSVFEPTNGEFEVEDNNSFATANQMPLNTTLGISGNAWNDDSDDDWYTFTTAVDGKLTINFSHDYKNSPYGWTVSVYKLNEMGSTILLQSKGCHLNDNKDCTLNVMGLKAGTYYVDVTGDSSVAGQIYHLVGKYEPSNGTFEAEPNDTLTQANAFAPNSTICGTNWKNESDEDWYAIDVTQLGNLSVSLSHNYYNSYSGWELSLYSINALGGTTLIKKESVDLRDSKIITVSGANLSPGRYYVKLVCDSGVEGEIYTLSNSFTPIISPAPTPTQTPTPGATITPSSTSTSVSKPKKVSISKLSKGKKHITVQWKKVSCTGYQVQYSTSKKFTKKTTKTVKIKSSKTTSKTIKKLKGNKKYYVRVRAYKTKSGKTAYGSYSKVKSVTTKK